MVKVIYLPIVLERFKKMTLKPSGRAYIHSYMYDYMCLCKCVSTATKQINIISNIRRRKTC